MTLPTWPPRDWRAFIALLASIAGAATLTVFTAWLVWIVWRGGWQPGTETARIEALAWAMLGALAIVGIVLISLGLAINRRTLKGSLGPASFEASGGDEDKPAPQAQVTTTTTVAVPAAPAPATGADAAAAADELAEAAADKADEIKGA